MAKAKKKEALSPEERLEQALVPVDEQPYEVPENWCWVKHNSILDISGGSQPAKSHFISEPAEGYTQLYQTRDYGENPVPVYIPDKYATKTTKEGDILLARYGGSLGKVFRAHEGAYNVALAKVIKLYPELIDDEFLFKYYFAQFYQNFCIKASSGRSAQAGFNREDMDSIPFPLPPLAEQQRIVEQIENLFKKLDEAKEKAQEALDSVESRKMSILYQAYTGKLSLKWREDGDFVYVNKTFAEICNKITDGFHNSPKPVEEGYPYVMAGSVKETGINYYNGLYMDEKNHRELYNKAHPERGDILMVNIGAGTGTAAVIDVDFEFSFKNSAILKLKQEMVNSYYVLYYLWLRKKYLLNEVTRGGAQPFLSLKIINTIEIPMCSLEEQEIIVQQISSMLEKEQETTSILMEVIDKIDVLKKSILSKAFRGELGTNNPDEESAVELLKSILATE